MDKELIAIARSAGDAHYDPEARLLRLPASGNRVHTRIQSGLVHPFNQSAGYVLAVLESGADGPAADILARIVAAQDADPASPWYGVWSYVAEEPLPAMTRPDPNWADFIGQDLLLVAMRHGDALPAAVRDGVHVAIARAATAVRRRDVHMAYTNIAAKGTFVTLAAGELLGDDELLAYGRDRMERFFAEVDRFGSFAEYNSPTYWHVTCAAVTAIMRYVADPRARELATIIHDRLWIHLATRWHAPTGQLGGPMSRAYATDLADNVPLLVYLAQATGYRPPFDVLPDLETAPVKQRLELASSVVLAPAAPASVVAALTGPGEVGRRRETFSAGPPARVGTTWLGPAATVGSVSQADSWCQRRNLLCLWRPAPSGGLGMMTGSPWDDRAAYAWLRVIKDDDDFVSGVFSSVQDGSDVLWHVGLASPGGDRHVYRDEITGPVALRSLRVTVEFAHVPDAVVTIDGRAAVAGSTFPVGAEVAVRAGDVTVSLRFVAAEFGAATIDGAGSRGRIRIDDDGRLFVDLDLLDAPEPVEVDLARVGPAWAAGTLAVIEHVGGADAGESGASATARLDRSADDGARLTWAPGRSRLELHARTAVGTVDEHAAAYRGLVNGTPITQEKVTQEKADSRG